TNFHNVVQRSYFSQGDDDGGSPFVYGALNALGGMADAYRGLLFDNRSPGGELFWSINTLVPKYDGEAIAVKNFEATIKFAMTNNLSGGLLFAFHESTAGQYTFSDSYTVRKSTGSVLAIGNSVDTKAGYGAAGSSTDSWKFYADGKVEANYMTNVDKNFGANLSGQWYTLTVKAVNGTATFTLTGEDGAVNETMTKTYTTESGALSLGVSGREVMVREIKLVELDAEGVPVDIGTYVANSAIVEGSVISVKPDDGYELKAGSLIVTDANGNKFVPTRVGYRDGGDASKYEVPAQAVAPYTVDYEFYQPTFNAPNIGTVGISYNKEKHGLRFITRFTRQVIDGVEYVVMGDGSKYAISDYGMLLAAESGLATTAATDAEDMVVGSANAYVKQFSAVELNKYYDICDNHIDLSACIINMDKVANFEEIKNMKIYSRSYVVVEAEGNEHVLYGDIFAASYYDSLYGTRSTSSVAELCKEGVVRIDGRHTITADGDVKVSFGNAGITLAGDLTGDIYLDAKYTKYAYGECRINVMVDGEYVDDVVAVYGDNHLKVVEDLELGYHTVTIAKGVGTPSLGDLVFKNVTYSGTLETPTVNDLQFMFLGDSITDTAGILGAYADAPDAAGVQLPSQNIRLGYAALTSKAFGADFTQVSFAGLTTSQVQCLFNEEAFPQGGTMIPYEYGSGDTTEKDVVVINLGTNNTAGTVNSEAKACLNAVRAKYPNAYIVWTYGMMFTDKDDVLSTAVAEWVSETGDSKTSYCSLTSAANTDGGAEHPLAFAHKDAADILTAHIADVLGTETA
ncbi:MAG: hypothetical protein J6L00_00550, partial [Clostridia bacterium]|nr:hypothetical protein [Clostridia bacterium]